MLLGFGRLNTSISNSIHLSNTSNLTNIENDKCQGLPICPCYFSCQRILFCLLVLCWLIFSICFKDQLIRNDQENIDKSSLQREGSTADLLRNEGKDL